MERNPCGPPSHRHQISGPSLGRRPEQDQAGVGERDRAARAGRPPARAGARERAEQRGLARFGCARRGHQSRRRRAPPPRRPGATAQGSSVGAVEQSARPSSPSPCRGGRARDVEDGGRGVEHARRSAARSRRRAGAPCASASTAATRASSSDEAVVVGGQLAVQPAGEGVRGELALEQRGGVRAATARDLGEPGKAQRGGEPPGRLGDDVVVGRGAVAAEGREVLLVPARSGAGRPGRARRGRPTSGQSSSSRRIQTQDEQPDARARSRWSSGRRTGTGSPATTTAAGRRRASAYRSSPVSQ